MAKKPEYVRVDGTPQIGDRLRLRTYPGVTMIVSEIRYYSAKGEFLTDGFTVERLSSQSAEQE